MTVGDVQATLEEGVRSGIFPSAQAVVFHQGAAVFEGHVGAAGARTLYDLASVTKAVATSTAFMSLWAEGVLHPETHLSDFWPSAPCAAEGATLADLLYHRSGLPAHLPFFEATLRKHPELQDARCPAHVRALAREEVVAAAVATQLASPRRSTAVYSDVGFILLGELLATAGRAPLDALVEARVLKPLALEVGYHRLSRPEAWEAETSASTGPTRPREPSKGIAAQPSRPGEVDDDNAWAMDGVAGHAGLFGSAHALARCGQAVLEELEGAERIAPRGLWSLAAFKDGATPGSDRALGWDTPSWRNSSAGRYLGKKAPGAVGHLGFTGVSLWLDRGRALVVALCANCTADGRAPMPRIREFRARFHDSVIEALALT